MKREVPCAGAYRKIDVFCDKGYLWSTEAYPSLRMAIIGAIISLERTGYSITTRMPYSGFETVKVNAYSVNAEYSKGGN